MKCKFISASTNNVEELIQMWLESDCHIVIDKIQMCPSSRIHTEGLSNTYECINVLIIYHYISHGCGIR